MASLSDEPGPANVTLGPTVGHTPSMTSAAASTMVTGTGSPASPPIETYLLVDGENLDATLGNSILNARPLPEQRPRWDRVREWVEATHGPVKALFFINATNQTASGFVQALVALEFQPILLTGSSTQKVVDIAIERTMTALLKRDQHVVLASHDGDFAVGLEALVRPGRRVSVLAFSEYVAGRIRDINGVEVFDLEDDVRCFNVALPRALRPIAIDRFDPERFL